MMHKFAVEKLIRDALPQRMIASGMEVNTRYLGDGEYDIELRKKLLEESQEVREASGKEELRGELADVLEVIQSLAQFHGMDFAEIVEAAESKRQERGGFQKRLYLKEVALPVDHPKLESYLACPEKYPPLQAPL